MELLFLLVSVLVGAGYLLRRSGLASENAAHDLTNVVFYVTLPALVFDALHRAELSWRLLAMPLFAWGMTLFGLGLACWIGSRLRLSPPKQGAFITSAIFGNTTFLGYPITEALLGNAALPSAIFYDLLGATIAANTLGAAVAARYGEKPKPTTPMWRRLLTFPPLWGMAAALVLHSVSVPDLAAELLARIGSLTAPLTMLTIGLSLDLRAWREDWHLVGLASAGRLIVLPGFVLAAALVLGLPLPLCDAAVLQAGMPTMFYSLTLALVFGLRVNLTVNAIMFSTVASFATLPLWRLLLSRL